RLVDPEPARHVQEDVLIVELHPPALLEHGEEQRDAAAIEADRVPTRHGEARARDQRLDLDQDRAAPLQRRQHGPSSPAQRPGRSARNAADGFCTSASPRSPISKTPTSLVDPKRFFTARSTRNECAPSPSKYSTVSTRCSSTRGPASAPSLVTWPIRMHAVPLALACAVSSAADSRPCPTLPGADASGGVCSVGMESTTTAAGRKAASCSTTASAAVSARIITSALPSPSRSARSRTCCGDSSPAT